MAAKSSEWSALFIPAPSPGQVVQAIERSGMGVPAGGFLLSDAVGPQKIRALLTPDAPPVVLEGMAQELSTRLESAVTFLYAKPNEGRWGYALYDNGVAGESSDNTYEAVAPKNFLARLTSRPAISLAATWAEKRGLPLERVPAATGHGVRIIGYELVARLEQKNLLVEDTPRLYRFLVQHNGDQLHLSTEPIQ